MSKRKGRGGKSRGSSPRKKPSRPKRIRNKPIDRDLLFDQIGMLLDYNDFQVDRTSRVAPEKYRIRKREVWHHYVIYFKDSISFDRLYEAIAIAKPVLSRTYRSQWWIVAGVGLRNDRLGWRSVSYKDQSSEVMDDAGYSSERWEDSRGYEFAYALAFHVRAPKRYEND